MYSRGKRLEAEGDLRGAYECFLKALKQRDRTDSALKDISNIYVMYGRIEEAIAFLKNNNSFVTNHRGYENLILRLQQELDLEFQAASITEGMPKTVLLTHTAGDLNTDFLAQVLPNVPKIRRVLIIDDERALIQFATYSSARKALNVLNPSPDRFSAMHALSLQWAATEDEKLMTALEKAEEAHSSSVLDSRRLQSLPSKLQVFLDKRSLVSFYHITDKVVLEIVENLLFSSSC